MSIVINVIVACCEGNGIGLNNQIPWNIKEDMKYFREKTINHAVIMGRNTQNSLPKPLKDRLNIVVSSSKNNVKEGFVYAESLSKAIKLAESCGHAEAWIIGGQQIYEQSLDYADNLYITEIYKSYGADRFFPSFDCTKFKEVSRLDKDELSFVKFSKNISEKY